MNSFCCMNNTTWHPIFLSLVLDDFLTFRGLEPRGILNPNFHSSEEFSKTAKLLFFRGYLIQCLEIIPWDLLISPGPTRGINNLATPGYSRALPKNYPELSRGIRQKSSQTVGLTWHIKLLSKAVKFFRVKVTCRWWRIVICWCQGRCWPWRGPLAPCDCTGVGTHPVHNIRQIGNSVELQGQKVDKNQELRYRDRQEAWIKF